MSIFRKIKAILQPRRVDDDAVSVAVETAMRDNRDAHNRFEDAIRALLDESANLRLNGASHAQTDKRA